MAESELNRRTRGKRWKTVRRNLRPLLFVTLLYGARARARATLSYAFVSLLKCSTLMLHFPVVHQKVTKFSITLIIERPFWDQFMFLGNCPPTPPLS